MTTLEELKTEIQTTYASVNDVQWTGMIREQGINRFTVEELEVLINNYVSDIDSSRQTLRVNGLQCTIVPCEADGSRKTENLLVSEMHDFFGEIDTAIAQEKHILDSLACCLKQKERLEV